ncbi:MAG: sodium:glutamate symporter [Geminicoccaceae bacterium]|nr:MAG: sodium:glutamate symporter [Geminicoccaceae bacterium]
MTVADVFVALLLIGALLVLGLVIRSRIALLRRLFLPSAIVAGVVALALGPEGLGRLVEAEGWLAGGLFPAATQEVWRALPGLLISVVFACLFLGKAIPHPRTIWAKAGPMVAHGQTLAWGQYAVGLTLAVFVLVPVFAVDPMAGALIEIGFEGGHGTAAGLASTFRELGFENGADLALGLATIGVVMGVLLGTVLVNWGVRTGRIDPASADADDDVADHDDREAVPTTAGGAVDPLAVHLGYVAIAIALGWLMLEGLVRLERLTWGAGPDGLELLVHVPLFPLAMIGGVLVQLALMRTRHDRAVDRRLINRVSGAALDVLIVAALATLSLAALGDLLLPLLLLAVAGIAWNLIGFVVLAPRMLGEQWVPMGLANFGQGMGMTVIGLLLIRMSDPGGQSDAMEAFGYKQLLFEPVVGGGLFTAASLPLIYNFGPVPVLIATTALMLAWLAFGLLAFGRQRRTAA